MDDICRSGAKADFFEMNVTNREQVSTMVQFAKSNYGKIDILVNNAGTDIKGSIQELPESTWDKIITLNLKAVFLCTQEVAKEMIQQKCGRIINISSIAGKTGEPFTSPYCASKFGIIGFTQAIASELGKYNITVNAICPGPVDTALIRESISQTARLNNRSYEEELNAKFLSLTPLGRIAQPKDIANAVAFLASDEAEYITGISLNVSGGREMH